MGMRFGGGMSSGMPDETTTITINTFKSDRNRLDGYPNEPYRLSFADCWTRAATPNSEVRGHSPASRHRSTISGGAVTHEALKWDLRSVTPIPHSHVIISYDDP